MEEEQINYKRHNYYEISEMNAYELYDKLIGECSFNTIILLYKLIKHKMEYLDDEPVEFCNMKKGD